MPNRNRHYSIIVKPIGSICNLRCEYCYYLGKECDCSAPVMTDEVLEQYIRSVIAIHGVDAEIEFAWHGGEPTLAGVDFYKKAVALQTKYGKGRKILNTLQTNGTLLNDEWCGFFAENDFRIGISVDGPEKLHNRFRKDIHGCGTFRCVMDAIDLLKKYHVQYNVLATVNAANVGHAAEVYRFLRTVSDYIQFLPVVECVGSGNDVALPPGIYTDGVAELRQPADYSVPAKEYGRFLCQVFDIWRKEDVGKKYVQIFEATIGNLTRRRAGLCVHESICGHCAAVEKSGELYRCDRYVFSPYRVGNIMSDSLGKMMESNRDFGEYKLESLSTRCLHCDVVDLCFGGCPKDRFVPTVTADTIEYQNYLCEGYREFFRYFKSSVAVR